MLRKFVIIALICAGIFSTQSFAHEVNFCGETIPTDRDFVASKLMVVIRKQIPAVTLSHLRYQSKIYFPAIIAWLKYYNIPEDFKYIPIVECGFRNNLTSKAGAAGFWQLMPATATEQGLVVTATYDQRMDPYRSTLAACRVILQHYAAIRNGLKKPSWVLTAASYNFGPGNIINAVRSQKTDYFGMKLNDETAEYVYRLIAVKELFERPELYMNGFGANIFSQEKMKPKHNDTSYVELREDERGTDLGSLSEDEKSAELKVADTKAEPEVETQTRLVSAKIISPPKHFRDGSELLFELQSNLQISDISRRKGAVMKGKAWLIDDRIYVDFGYGPDIELQDASMIKGISIKDAEKNGQYVALKTQVPVY